MCTVGFIYSWSPGIAFGNKPKRFVDSSNFGPGCWCWCGCLEKDQTLKSDNRFPSHELDLSFKVDRSIPDLVYTWYDLQQ